VSWYTNDLNNRAKDIDAALGGAMSEIEGMAIDYWKQSGKPDCPGVQAAQKLVEAETSYQALTAYRADSAYKSKIAIKTKEILAQQAAAASAAGTSTTTWLVGAAVVGGLAWYFWPKRR
jgi:hypothetical protein